jgi:hypothetical protein
MNCPKCHRPISDGLVFCTECGTKLDARKLSSADAATFVQEPPKQAEPKTPIPTLTYVGAPIHQTPNKPELVPQKQRKPIFGIVLVLLVVFVIAAIAAGLLFFRKNEPQAKPENTNTTERTTQGSAGPVGGTLQTGTNSLGTRILGRWRNKSGKLEIEFKEGPTGIEGFVQRVPEAWPRNRVKVGDAIFTKGKIVGETIEGLYVNLPQNTDCQGIETRYSKCVITFESDNTLRVTNSAWKYSFPECKWSSVTYDDTWNWFKF